MGRWTMIVIASCAVACLRGASTGAAPSDDAIDTAMPSPTPTEAEPPLEAPQPPSFTVLYDVKTLGFAWDPDPSADFMLLEHYASGKKPETVVEVNGSATYASQYVSLFDVVRTEFRLRACNEAGCATSDPVYLAPPLRGPIGYIKALETLAGAQFGSSVATCDDGSVLAVSSPGRTRVDIYELIEEEGWVFTEAVNGLGSPGSKQFPQPIALSADCDTLAVGAPGALVGSWTAGSVSLWLRTKVGWQSDGAVFADNGSNGDAFGAAVALSEDGTRLVVGAPYEDHGSYAYDADTQTDSGAAYTFERTTSWTQTQRIKASSTSEGAAFGASVATANRGVRLVIGAPMDPVNDILPRGHAFVLQFDAVSGLFEETSAMEGNPWMAEDAFGYSVSIGDDGTVAVGAPNSGSGRVFLFRLVDGWRNATPLSPSRLEKNDQFGFAVSMSRDGTRLAVSSPGEESTSSGVDPVPQGSSPDAGATFLFELPDDAAWSELAYLKASNPGAMDRFGQSVALSGDGKTLAVGAPFEASTTFGVLTGEASTDDGAFGAGAVYLY